MEGDTNPMDLELAEPYLLGWLATVGLDVEYVRGSGNTLYYRDADGAEVGVLDCVGGYGSLILGHNHPALAEYARSLLTAQTPIHAQFSRHPYANQLALALNTILHREFDTDEPYSVIYGNSGAEAIEAAIKHAELDRVMRIAALGAEIDRHIEQARLAVRRGTATVPQATYDRLGAEPSADPFDFEHLLSALVRHNTETFSAPPVLLALDGGFHGKLMGSTQLTHNPGYRTPFGALANTARFVPVDQPDAVAKIVEEERETVLDLVVTDGLVQLVERDAPVFCAFLLEPIQGEGGITVLGQEMADRIAEVCATVDCPIVVDEIQSGVGRSGAFFASSHLGLRGDYYTLAKSLGGGLAKISAMLVRRSRYRQDFELVHSSTFAKDSYSCLIAIEVLKLLESEGGAAYRRAAERGERLAAALASVRADFPEVVKDVRGRGLMLGVEFHDQSEAAAPRIRDHARAGLLGYALAGYLLREHRVRIFPTASATNTLRIEPSIELTDAEIDHLAGALRALCTVLRDQDEHTSAIP